MHPQPTTLPRDTLRCSKIATTPTRTAQIQPRARILDSIFCQTDLARTLLSTSSMRSPLANLARVLLVLLVITAATSPAWAQDVGIGASPELTPSARVKSKDTRRPHRASCEMRGDCTEWYGAPIVALDVAALALPFIGAGTAQNGDAAQAFIVGAVGLYALGGPIVHFSEERVGTGFASLGLRLGAPLAGGLAGIVVGGAAVSGCTGEMCGLGALVYGAAGVGIGMIAAAVVDSAVLARKPTVRPQLSLSVVPTYQPATGEKGLSLSGTW